MIRAMLKEFRDFAIKGNVVDMAVGVIIGSAFGKIISSLVSDILMPPIGKLIGGADFSSYFLVLGEGSFATIEAAKEAGVATLNYGLFINNIINFVIVAFCIFAFIKVINLAKRKEELKIQAAAPTPRDIQLLEEIRDLLRK